jgi:hypothetical protein
VHERLHEPDLLPVALGQAPDPRAEVEVQAVGERLDPASGQATAQIAQVGQDLVDRLLRVDDEVAGQVAEPPAERYALAARIEPEHHGRACRRPNQVEEQPDRRRLAGPRAQRLRRTRDFYAYLEREFPRLVEAFLDQAGR